MADQIRNQEENIRSRVVFRPMEGDDIAHVLRLERETFSDAWSEQDFWDTLNYAYMYPAVAVLDGEIIGYVIYSVIFEEMNIDNLCVKETVRKLHIGKALVEDALNAGKEKGAERCGLEVRAGNLPAIALYEKEGFIFDRVRKEYYRNPLEDAKLYHKDLK